MKHFINSFLVSLLLTVLIVISFCFFAQETFFTATINLITQICMLVLLAVIWYLFFLDLWQHRKNFSVYGSESKTKEAILPKTEKTETIVQESEPATDTLSNEEDLVIVDSSETDMESILFIPKPAQSEEWTKAAESNEKPAKNNNSVTSDGATNSTAKKQRMTRAQRKRLNAELNQKKSDEKAQKLKQAAEEKQAQRARKQEEDAAKQQQKLEDLKAEAARKKAASDSKKTSWNKSGKS